MTGIFTVCDHMDVSLCCGCSHNLLAWACPGRKGSSCCWLGWEVGRALGEQAGRGGRQRQAGEGELEVKSVLEKFDGARQRKKYTCLGMGHTLTVLGLGTGLDTPTL